MQKSDNPQNGHVDDTGGEQQLVAGVLLGMLPQRVHVRYVQYLKEKTTVGYSVLAISMFSGSRIFQSAGIAFHTKNNQKFQIEIIRVGSK